MNMKLSQWGTAGFVTANFNEMMMQLSASAATSITGNTIAKGDTNLLLMRILQIAQNCAFKCSN